MLFEVHLDNLLTIDRCLQSFEVDFNTIQLSFASLEISLAILNQTSFLHHLKKTKRCMQSKRRDSHWKWLHRGTYDYILTSVLFFHSVPVQGGQAIPLYLEAILVMLSSLSTALQQEKEFINVIWWVHKYFKLTNGQSFPSLFQNFSIRNLDHRIMAIFTGT